MLYIWVKQTSDRMINYSAIWVCRDNGFLPISNLTIETQPWSPFTSQFFSWVGKTMTHQFNKQPNGPSVKTFVIMRQSCLIEDEWIMCFAHDGKKHNFSKDQSSIRGQQGSAPFQERVWSYCAFHMSASALLVRSSWVHLKYNTPKPKLKTSMNDNIYH